MGHHSSDYENAAADLVEYYGQPIFYTDPDNVNEVEIDASVFPERSDRRQKQSGGWDRIQVRDVYFAESAITLRLDGRFRIGDEKYAIESTGRAVGSRTKVTLKRLTAGEISRPGTRR